MFMQINIVRSCDSIVLLLLNRVNCKNRPSVMSKLHAQSLHFQKCRRSPCGEPLASDDIHTKGSPQGLRLYFQKCRDNACNLTKPQTVFAINSFLI